MTIETFVSESNGNLFNLDASRGFVKGHKTLYKYGFNSDINGTEETVWDGGGIYVHPTSAAQLYVSSSSAADAVAGTGVQEITIEGLDANYNEISENITLTGQTQKITVNSYLRVYRAFAVLAGTGGTAAGDIYVATSGASAGVPTGTTYAKISVGANQTLMSVFTVPAGYTLYLDDVNFTGAVSLANSYATIRFMTREFGSNVFRDQVKVVIQSFSFLNEYQYPLAISEKTDIEVRAVCTSNNNPISASYQGILIKNDIDI